MTNEVRCKQCGRLLFKWGTEDPRTWLEFTYADDSQNGTWIEVKCKGGACSNVSRIRIDTVGVDTVAAQT